MAQPITTESRALSKIGNSVGGTIPKGLAEKHGLIDEDGDPVEDVELQTFIDPERGVIGLEVSIDG